MITTFKTRWAERNNDESGFTTAELLANAALGVLALAAIWGFFKGEVFGDVQTIVRNALNNG